VREMLRRGECPPPEFSRPEVAAELAKVMHQMAVQEAASGFSI
jgi:sulfate adenylyltransferase